MKNLGSGAEQSFQQTPYCHGEKTLRGEIEQNSKHKISNKRVDGAVAVVDQRLGEFKEQFMLPVGSVIPKYVGVEIHWILENLCPGYLCRRNVLFFRKERQARVKKHGHLNLTEEELAKIKAGKAEKLQRLANQRETQK